MLQYGCSDSTGGSQSCGWYLAVGADQDLRLLSGFQTKANSNTGQILAARTLSLNSTVRILLICSWSSTYISTSRATKPFFPLRSFSWRPLQRAFLVYWETKRLYWPVVQSTGQFNSSKLQSLPATSKKRSASQIVDYGIIRLSRIDFRKVTISKQFIFNGRTRASCGIYL